MNTKAKILTFLGALLLVGLVAFLFLPDRSKKSTTGEETLTSPPTDTSTPPASEPATTQATDVDPFGPTTSPATAPAMGTSVNIPETTDPVALALDHGIMGGSAGAGQTFGREATGSGGSNKAPIPDTVTVAAGDSIQAISTKHYGSAKYARDIAAANPRVNTRSLRPGTILKLPKIDTSADRTAAMAGTGNGTGATGSAAGTGTGAGVGTGKTHTVKSGESLEKISTIHYGSPKMWRKIYELNKKTIGASPSRLRAGMVLQLPEASAPTTPSR